MTTLERIYEDSHESEAFALTKILTRSSTLFAIYLFDFIILQVSKLSKCLQYQNLDATLHTLDDIIQPAANWLLELLEGMDEMESTIGIMFTTEDITAFQSRVAKPFFTVLKENVQNRFSSHDVVSTFSIFEPKNAKKL